MKISCFNRIFHVFVILTIYTSGTYGYAQNDTLFVSNDFESANLIDITSTYSSNSDEDILEMTNLFKLNKQGSTNHFYFDFNNQFNYLQFTVKNSGNQFRRLILEFSNSHIDEVVVYQKEMSDFILISETGIEYPFQSRLIPDRKFLIPIELSNNESHTYMIKLKKDIGRPLITAIKLFDDKVFNRQRLGQYILIGSYFGLSFLSILFSLFAFYFLRNYSYLIYALYVVFLGLFICSYLGIFQQFFLSEGILFNKYLHYVLFSEISLLLFIIFSQKVLNVKESLPKLKKVIDILVITIVSIRFSIHFVFQELFLDFIPFFMKIWYSIILVICLLIVFEIIVIYKKNKERASLFALAYIFMTLGAIITVLYHSSGVVNSYVYGLPLIFYSSLLEILFLTFTIVYMVKEIYDQRNILSNQLAHQQQRFLTAFIDGQEKERERIGKELHDNVGSKLSHFKRIFSKNFSDKKMIDEIDVLCNDVRNLSHQISPSEIKLVGLPGAISDLITKYSDDGLTIEFNCYEFPKKIDENITSNLYRIVQESLNNIIKHAQANFVDVQLVGHKSHLTLTIEDDGKGFNNSKVFSGIGLHNMKSRVEQLKGNFLLDTSLNKGTSILVTVPIN